MQLWLRKFLLGVIGVEALIFLSTLPIALLVLLQSRVRSPFLNIPEFLLPPAAMTLLGFIFAAAWWQNRQARKYARAWGIAASLINVGIAIPLLIYLPWSASTLLWIPPVGGVLGIYIFSRKQTVAIPREEGLRRPIPGDGTNKVLDRITKPLSFAMGVALVIWWLNWNQARGIRGQNDIFLYLQIFVALLSTTLIHECGHVAVGLALGMKLRVFVIGPLEWKMRGGKWEFHFDLKALLSNGGKAGVVPVDAKFARWRMAAMIAGGPGINLFSAAIFLVLASRYADQKATALPGFLALLGAASLWAFVFNLIPQRTRTNYSDGAQIYQLLSTGPWGDMHQAILVVSSSLVTPLRPRDYDLVTIERAANGIQQGRKVMLLWLYVYQHYLDHHLLVESDEALLKAEQLYHEVAAEVTAELHTVFVFAVALLRRDAAATRAWWQRMEAKKPTRFNSDYWMAHSALHWMEGDRRTAEESWAKGNELAQKLPQAGAYDFDRHCFALLREAMDEPLAAA